MASIAVERPGQTKVAGTVRGATRVLLLVAGVGVF
jgi:hypothetical protein